MRKDGNLVDIDGRAYGQSALLLMLCKKLKLTAEEEVAVDIINAMLASTKPVETLTAWHQRTHLSVELLMMKLVKLNTVTGCNIKSNKEIYSKSSLCTACQLGKHTRRAFKKDSHLPIHQNNYVVIYSDVEEVTPIGGVQNKRYITSFICARSKYKVLYYIADKTESAAKLKTFILQHVVPLQTKPTQDIKSNINIQHPIL